LSVAISIGFAQYFNPRPSARGDAGIWNGITGKFISIHAPPRGATFMRASTPMPTAFQSTPLREGRQPLGYDNNVLSVFQSTPLREGRPCSFCRYVTRFYFNPRPSARGDTGIIAFSPKSALFQSTPLREGRLALVGFES